MKRLGYHEVRRFGRRLGRADHRLHRRPAPPGLLGIHTNMAGDPARRSRRAFAGAPAAARPVADEDAIRSTTVVLLRAWPWLCAGDEAAAGDASTASRIRRSRSPPGSSTTTSGAIARSPSVRRRATRADQGRHPRQHHALLADQHGGVVGAALLGELQGNGASSRPSGLSRCRPVVSAFPGNLPDPEKWAEPAYPGLIFTRRIRRARISPRGSSHSAIVDDLRDGFRSLR